MEVRVRLFGPAADALGADSVLIRLEPGDDESAARARLAEAAPAIAELARRGRLAVNHEFAPPGRAITAGDEVALISMVNGG